MTLVDFISFFFEGLGTPVQDVLLVVVVCTCLLFYTRDLRLGSMLSFIILGFFFMLVFVMGLPYGNALIAFLFSLALMCMNLFVSFAKTGGSIA